MVLFTILFLTLLFLVIFSVFAIAAGGAVMVVLFSDVIVCIAIICWIMKKIKNRNHRHKI